MVCRGLQPHAGELILGVCVWDGAHLGCLQDGDGQVLGSLQLFWDDVYMKYGVIQRYNPDNYPDWIEVRVGAGCSLKCRAHQAFTACK